jgi:hypothetical protein
MKSLCVFCGSNAGINPVYAGAARAVGAEVVRRGLRLIYGGGNVGLMGIVADAVLALGGEVIGVIPHALAAKEVAHGGLTRLHTVGSMHERKALMAELSDGFLALPGGYGTLDEYFEILTWAQLGLHAKPCGLLNVGGFFDTLLAFLGRSVAEGFLREKHRALILVGKEPGDVLGMMAHYRPIPTEKWIGKEET